MERSQSVFLGVDVQIRRSIPVAVLDEDARVVDSQWFPAADAPRSLADLVADLGPVRCIVGIDAPAMPLPALRRWSFSRTGWTPVDGMIGRHCEVVIKALGLGNPQWTPPLGEAPGWMRLGFALFAAAIEAGASVFEVFPTATYRALEAAAPDSTRVTLPLSGLVPGPKDMLDAVAAAYTVLRHRRGTGCEVGGGDGLGSIVLPDGVTDHPALHWPGERELDATRGR